jgi:predicted RNA-binding protein YlxR (DUF448 family)
MCIGCKERMNQNEMLRLKCENKKLVSYDHYGRSFYICNKCIEHALTENKNQKKLEHALYRVCKSKDDYIIQLKEILTHVR